MKRTLPTTPRVPIRAGVSAVILTLLVGCATRNIVQAPTGRFEVKPGFNQYSPEQDIEIGRQGAAEVKRQMPVLPDSSPVSKYVEQLGKQLASHAPGDIKWPFTFDAVNVKEINAFALPGGPTFVHVGTIQSADDEGQLAGVMAHELAHVILRHGTQQASKASFAQLPLAVLGAAVGRGAAGTITQVGASLAVQSVFLKYSRDAEREADLLGSQIMYDAGYNPFSMVEFFSKLEAEGGSRGPQFLSDHPNPGNRVESVRQAIAKYPKKTYRRDSADFERIKSQVAQLKPLSMEEVARRQPKQGTIENVSLRDVMPSGRFRTMDHSAFRMSYPDNWDVAGDANSPVTIAPRAAVAENAVAYGVIINGMRAQRGTGSLDQATEELVDMLQRSNPGTRAQGSIRQITVGGAPARSIYLVGKSPLKDGSNQLDERDWLVTVQRPDSSVLYLVFVAPERDFNELANSYQDMLRTLQLR